MCSYITHNYCPACAKWYRKSKAKTVIGRKYCLKCGHRLRTLSPFTSKSRARRFDFEGDMEITVWQSGAKVTLKKI